MSRTDDRVQIDLQELIDTETVQLARFAPDKIIESFFSIVDKYGKVVPFILNTPQRDYFDSKTYRDDVLKARKEGFSSLILAVFTVYFLFLENVNCVCISHEKESTQRLFEKVLFYIENMTTPDGVHIHVELTGRSRSSIKYRFRRIDDSGKEYWCTNTFYIGTAGSKSFGRGDTIHYLHLSECAFWEEASRIMTGLLNAVPDDRNSTYIVKESTANGSGTPHHTEWVAEMEGRSSFKPHFFGWQQDPVNRLELKEYKERTGSDFIQTDAEVSLAIKYQLALEQLAWRRWKTSSMQPDSKHTKEDLFMQEFPISAQEAFLSSGKPIFDLKTIEWYEEAVCKEPSFIGELTGWNPPFLNEVSTGELFIWDKPIIGRVYCIGADVAESGDFSHASVIDRRTYEQVAQYNGHMDEFEFASLLFRLGVYYNTALLCPEQNNQGVAVIKKLDELGYTNMYRRETIDEITKTVHNDLGWRTDSVTRPIMISDFNQDVTNRKYKFRSKLLAAQMRTFVRNTRGKAEAQSSCHDDAVIANCIAVQMYKTLPDVENNSELVYRDYTPNTSVYNFYNSRK